MRNGLDIHLLGAVLAQVQAGAPAAQTGKYDSIPATAPASRFADTATGLQWKRCSEGPTWSGGT